MKDQHQICERLDWDSSFFQRTIARITSNYLTHETAAKALTWCSDRQVEGLYFLADASDPATVRAAEDAGFRLMDIRLTLERRLTEISSERSTGVVIRRGTPQDSAALMRIAGSGHRDSRFYQDPNFSPSLCDKLYETWIQKSLHGYADAVLVAEREESVVGYISCHLPSPATGQIGLFAVGSEARGLGLGQHLVNESLRWFQQQGVSVINVITQGRNVAAQRVYQRCGFLTRSVQLWYHYWFPLPGDVADEHTSHSV